MNVKKIETSNTTVKEAGNVYISNGNSSCRLDTVALFTIGEKVVFFHYVNGYSKSLDLAKLLLNWQHMQKKWLASQDLTGIMAEQRNLKYNALCKDTARIEYVNL